MTFPSINPALDRALAARNYATPTAVQLAVLADEARDRDLLVSAQTGSGKTVAFGMAIAATLLGTSERFERAAEPLALIIAPTRELAMQVQRELAWLYAETGARITTCVGGMDARAEGRQLSIGAHIVVGTPGRLRDHIERKRLDLSRLQAIVLDEADEMLDLGFREDLEFILETTPAERRTLLFSATMPRDIETMARRYQRDAFRIETIRRNEQHADIEYRAIKVAPHDVEKAVVNLLRYYEPRASLVFCSTRESVKRMHAGLVERGFAAVALSGELTQHERTQALVAVRDGRARVLVATDVAARGLDLPDLALVIHGELPNDRETLLHRSGRTGRAGNKGLCVLVVPFNRRRKAEALLAAARVAVSWAPAPTTAEVHQRDQERFLADPIFTDPASEHELALASALQAGRSSDAIALALLRLHRARLPEPEELAEDRGPPLRDDRGRRPDQDSRFSRHGSESTPPWKRHDRTDSSTGGYPRETGGSRPPRASRGDGREMVWFRLNIGRERNADPRWILPLICTAGEITKAEIGTIRISDRETRFEIDAEHADQFAHAVRTSKNKQGHISRIGTDDDAGGAAPNEDSARRGPRSAGSERPEHRQRKPWQDRDAPPARSHAAAHSDSTSGSHSAPRSEPRAPNRATGKKRHESSYSTGGSHDRPGPDSHLKRKRKNHVA
jgi:ATP-dependent RNA helicase DeaD